MPCSQLSAKWELVLAHDKPSVIYSETSKHETPKLNNDYGKPPIRPFSLQKTKILAPSPSPLLPLLPSLLVVVSSEGFNVPLCVSPLCLASYH